MRTSRVVPMIEIAFLTSRSGENYANSHQAGAPRIDVIALSGRRIDDRMVDFGRQPCRFLLQ